MSDIFGGRIVTEVAGKVVVTDEEHTVVTQGDTEANAWEMLGEAKMLHDEGGRQVDSVELMHDFGLSTEPLNANPLPTDFSEYSPTDSYLSPQSIGFTLMRHAFSPFSRTDNHLKMVSIRDPCEYSVIIPMTEEYLDHYVSGFIAGNITGAEVEPNNVIGWFEEG